MCTVYAVQRQKGRQGTEEDDKLTARAEEFHSLNMRRSPHGPNKDEPWIDSGNLPCPFVTTFVQNLICKILQITGQTEIYYFKKTASEITKLICNLKLFWMQLLECLQKCLLLHFPKMSQNLLCPKFSLYRKAQFTFMQLFKTILYCTIFLFSPEPGHGTCKDTWDWTEIN